MMDLFNAQIGKWNFEVTVFDVSAAKTKEAMLILGGAIVIGFLFCFFGLKLVRVWGAIIGLLVGAGAGFAIASMFPLETVAVNAIAVAAGVIFAVLGAWLYKVGSLFVGWAAGASVSAVIIRPSDWKLLLVCAVIGLIVGIISLIFAEPVLIIVTGIYGGMVAGYAAAALISLKQTFIMIIIQVVLVILGIVIQFAMESSKRNKRNLKKAAEIREKHSTANEVDRARSILDELDEKEK